MSHKRSNCIPLGIPSKRGASYGRDRDWRCSQTNEAPLKRLLQSRQSRPSAKSGLGSRAAHDAYAAPVAHPFLS